jgi:hypothetical protein
MSYDDTGATRVTDIERNLLVASTDLIGLKNDIGKTVHQKSATFQTTRMLQQRKNIPSQI